MPRSRTAIIESMARTLIVVSFADWCEETEDPDNDYLREMADNLGFQARAGQDWMNTTPGFTEEIRREALIEAAVLYGRIQEAWDAEPWMLVPKDELETWGHYAVMSALGSGVCWEDSHPRLHWDGYDYKVGWVRDDQRATTRGADILIENLDIDWPAAVKQALEAVEV